MRRFLLTVTAAVVLAVFSNRLLIAAGGSGGFTPNTEEDMRIVAKLTRLSNIVVTDNAAFPYDTAVILDTAYATWAGEGDPLVIVQSSWYWLWLNSTTLGTGYGGPSNADWLHAVARNGISLDNTLPGAARDSSGNGLSAQIMSSGSPVYLEAGDELETYYQNLVSGQTTLLVESNPSVGPDYTTCVGPGTLSPHLILVKMSGDAP